MTPHDLESSDELTCAIVRFDAPANRISVTDEKILQFLEQTAATQISEAERLLRLADYYDVEDFEDDWLGLRRIYEAAAVRDPDSASIRYAWGVAAMRS